MLADSLLFIFVYDADAQHTVFVNMCKLRLTLTQSTRWRQQSNSLTNDDFGLIVNVCVCVYCTSAHSCVFNNPALQQKHYQFCVRSVKAAFPLLFFWFLCSRTVTFVSTTHARCFVYCCWSLALPLSRSLSSVPVSELCTIIMLFFIYLCFKSKLVCGYGQYYTHSTHTAQRYVPHRLIRWKLTCGPCIRLCTHPVIYLYYMR